MKSSGFEARIAERLTAEGFSFEREPSVGGLRPDFLVKGPQGQLVVVEAKGWDPRGGNTARALEQAELYKKATGADGAFVVLPELKRNFQQEGVVNADRLVSALRSFFETQPPRRRQPPRSGDTDRIVFAAMPFDRRYDDTFLVAMAHAAEKIDAACRRVDRTEFSGDVVEEVRRLIASSIAVIVDLSESKPNVLYEAGYAHALGKPAVHICSTPLAELPFDVRNWNTIAYHPGQTAKLRDALARRLRSVVSA